MKMMLMRMTNNDVENQQFISFRKKKKSNMHQHILNIRAHFKTDQIFI